MEKIELGAVNKPFGLDGEMRIYSYTSFASLRFKKGAKMFLENKKGDSLPVTVSSFRDGKDFLFVKFKEINSIEEVENHIHDIVIIDKENATLPDGYYRLGELEGCEVYDSETNELLGEVKRVETNTPTATLRVSRKEDKDFFVPFIFDTFIVSVDTENKKIVIKVMKGLL